MSFSSVSAVDCEQVNVCWVQSYQFINIEITYCRNDQQTYKNLSEIEVHKKRVWPKVVLLKKYFSLQVTAFSRREQFLSGYCVSLSHKSSCGHSCLNGYGIFQKSTYSHKLRIHNVFDKYMKSIELICNSSCSHPVDECPFFYYKRTIAAKHSHKFTMSCSKSCRVAARRYHIY